MGYKQTKTLPEVIISSRMTFSKLIITKKNQRIACVFILTKIYRNDNLEINKKKLLNFLLQFLKYQPFSTNSTEEDGQWSQGLISAVNFKSKS